ncbi:Protein CBG26468 [Caenorhabditis briggsae]|uniref:Protein CBG26468 n=1 Tax=Caenorhabditis briggsae TaxID=6238 RepID=B6IFR5_CAEBR|nr:Protein CBG26468 [Caenorhabditis briggsae]CAR98745.1 Protein CBG26468 [Caenorhabditis briggsae]
MSWNQPLPFQTCLALLAQFLVSWNDKIYELLTFSELRNFGERN